MITKNFTAYLCYLNINEYLNLCVKSFKMNNCRFFVVQAMQIEPFTQIPNIKNRNSFEIVD